MNARNLTLCLGCAVLLSACATQTPQEERSLKFHVSDRAMEIIDEQGKASATMLSHAGGNDTELVCERFYKTGSHITTNVCYTRAEWQRRRLNHQEAWRDMTQGGPCAPFVDKVTLTRTGPAGGSFSAGGGGRGCAAGAR